MLKSINKSTALTWSASAAPVLTVSPPAAAARHCSAAVVAPGSPAGPTIAHKLHTHVTQQPLASCVSISNKNGLSV